MSEKIRHGWFSEKAASQHGGSYYKTPKGGKVRITSVTETMNHGSGWKDIQYVGQVTDWIGNFEPFDDDYEKTDGYKIKKQYPIEDADTTGLTFEVIKLREPKAPCPLAYNGVGNCTCGRCPKPKPADRNPFRY